MKCNLKRHDTYMTCCGLESTIHQQMSYRDIIDNVVCLGSNNMPQIPNNVKNITAKIKIPNLEIPFYAFVDIASLKGMNSFDLALSPVTTTLLERYGVTPAQFAIDFCKETLVTAVL